MRNCSPKKDEARRIAANIAGLPEIAALNFDCPVLGVKQTWRERASMSVLTQSGHCADVLQCPLMTQSGHRQCVFKMCLKPLAPAIVQRHDARFEPCRGHELQAQ